MPPEYWVVFTVAGAFLLLGVAGSPLAWALFHLRRSRFEERMERRWSRLAEDVRAVAERLTQYEALKSSATGVSRQGAGVFQVNGGSRRAATSARRGDSGIGSLVPGMVTAGRVSRVAEGPPEPALISVPNLEGGPNDRDATISGLKERYAAIWALADTGAATETISRATGQPMGQIELILGLRRQIDQNNSFSS